VIYEASTPREIALIHKDSSENSNPVPGNGKLPAELSAAVGILAIAPISDRVAPSSKSVPEWVAYVAPDFVQSNVSTIAGAKKLIEAKKALRKTKGSFCQLVEALGMDLDKAERLMVIARHPVLSDSAHARNLPLSWMTQFTLAKISAEVLAQLIADGAVHPELERKEAERLVERVRQRNSTNGGGGETRTENRGGDDGGGHGEQHDDAGGNDEGGDHRDLGEDNREQPSEIGNPPIAQDVGPNSKSEVDRKLARLEELEPRVVMLERVKFALESEVEELKAKLDEVSVRHQRRLFRQALDSISQAETSSISGKEKRSLHNSAITDLIEFVRSATRDGLNLSQFDIFCRPEPH
jgi:hypothetical protein